MKKSFYAVSMFIAMSVGFTSCTQCCKQKNISEEPETITPVTEVQQPEKRLSQSAAADEHKTHRVVHEPSPEQNSAPAADTVPLVQKATFLAVHNARANVDWAGTYTGILPCADCDGIAVEFDLRNDGTYDLVYHYLGLEALPYELMGQFTWDTTGSEIIIDAAEETHTPTRYKVGKNSLLELDFSGKEITGALANHYILAKK